MGMTNIGAGQNGYSPFGMEMGQFLLEGDLAGMNYHSFAYNRGMAPQDRSYHPA
jgi:hypothetical protein